LTPTPKNSSSPSNRKFPIRTDTKAPAFAGWQERSTSDLAQFAQWAQELPGCAWAIACAESQLIGVEIDPKARKSVKDKNSEQAGHDRAWDAWKQLCGSWGFPEPLTPHIVSRSGGFHIYFRAPADVDLRAARQRGEYPLRQRGLIKLEGWQQHVIETRVNGFLLIPPSTFGGRAYTHFPDAPTEPYPAPPQLIEALRDEAKKAGPAALRRGAPPDPSTVKAGTYQARPFAKYVLKVHHHVGMPYEVWRSTIFSMVQQFGRYTAWKIADAMHDGEPGTTYLINDLVTRAREDFKPGDATLNTLFKYAHDHGIKDGVPKSAHAMFGGPVPQIDIDSILNEIDMEALTIIPTPVVIAPPPFAAEILEVAPALLPQGAVPLTSGGVEKTPAVLVETQDFIAADLVNEYADKLRYCEELKQWFSWNGLLWMRDRTSGVYDLVRKYVRFRALNSKADTKKVLNGGFISGVETLARKDQRIATLAEMWDAMLFILNTPAGPVDLRTGELMPLNSSMLLSKSTSVAPEGGCPLWKKFLLEAMGGNQEAVDFLQLMCGMALSGEIRDHAIFFLYGPGGNGKSVFLSTVSHILADYHRSMMQETITERGAGHDRHPTEIASVVGARLVTVSETEKGRRWSETRVKQLTGGDTVTARVISGNPFDFIPQLTMIISGNFKPSLGSVGDAMKRRLHLIPFTHKPAKPDPDLTKKLEEEHAGILAWMIEGAVKWYRDGLHAPESVKEATKEYISGEDTTGQWLDEKCVLKSDAWTPRTLSFQAWQQWAEQSREPIGSSKVFYETMRQRGFEERKREGTMGFVGLELRPLVIPQREAAE
jgi:putative DNA primase/helicase